MRDTYTETIEALDYWRASGGLDAYEMLDVLSDPDMLRLEVGANNPHGVAVYCVTMEVEIEMLEAREARYV